MRRLAFLWAFLLAISEQSLAACQPDEAGELLRPGYSLLVSSMHPPLLQLTDEQLRALSGTPFDGIAVDVISPYDGRSLPDEERLVQSCPRLRTGAAHPIWPRVYSNRAVETSEKLRARKVHRNPDYFARIRGMDLDNRAGARDDFLHLVRTGLRAARALGAPGIVLDLEVYNHSDGYRVCWIAQRQDKTPTEVIASLKDLGARVADLVGNEYPGAVLWSLFTALDRPAEYREPSGNYFTAASYICMGLLERAASKKLPLLLVSGGEWGGYCYASVAAMRRRFEQRNAGFQPWLEKYPRHLALAATITVWGDAKNNRGWVLKDAKADTPYRRLADFEPLLAEMFRTYRYVWFYAPSVADYRPLDEPGSAEMNRQLGQLLKRTRSPKQTEQ